LSQVENNIQEFGKLAFPDPLLMYVNEIISDEFIPIQYVNDDTRMKFINILKKKIEFLAISKINDGCKLTEESRDPLLLVYLSVQTNIKFATEILKFIKNSNII